MDSILGGRGLAFTSIGNFVLVGKVYLQAKHETTNENNPRHRQHGLFVLLSSDLFLLNSSSQGRGVFGVLVGVAVGATVEVGVKVGVAAPVRLTVNV